MTALPANAPVRILDLYLDPATRRVSRAGEPLALNDLCFDLLLALNEAHPEPLGAAELARRVWHQDHVSEDTLAQRIAMLRRALGDDARQPRYVRTVRNRGYALIPVPEPVTARRAPGPRRIVWTGGVAAALTTAVITAAAWQGFMSENLATADSPAMRAAAASGDLDRTIRVRHARDLLDLHRPRETSDAIALLETALADAPEDREVRIVLSFALSTRATKFEAVPDDITRAEALAQSVIDTGADDADAWHALAYALDGQGRLDDAVAAYQQAYTLAPDDVAAMSSAAYLMQIRGRLFDALQLEARALGSGAPSRYGPVQIATTLSLLDLPAAETWWRHAEAGGADGIVYLGARVMADLRHGATEQALARIEAAPAEIRNTPRIRHLEGRIRLRLNDREGAARLFDLAGDMAELDRAALAAMNGERVDPASFRPLISHALATGKSWPDLRISLAGIEAQTGDIARAASLVGQAIDLGWRDRAALETSPLLAPLTASDAWPELRDRMDREIAGQRRLVLAAPDLRDLVSSD